ncbi:MAG: DctP family TRAP transporter solute-binding subunit [Firmicutes bacterium]|nr:DctP family TRAP transporter solute-binding subunit [Bacillota bacterium]
MRKKLVSIIMLSLIITVMVGTMASAASYVLRFNHVLGPSHPYHQAFLNWAERVYERTDGDLEIKIFHSSQLGVEEDILEQVRQGVPVGQNTDSARLGNYVPGIAVMNAPYFVNSIEDVKKLNELPIVQEWEEELAEEYGFKVISFNWVQGFRHFMTNKPIKTPEDLNGLRIRTPPAPIWQESVKALGAVPTALNFSEIYTGLQQGAVDGAELVYDNITAGNLYEVLDYVNETKHFLLINFQVISNQWFESLPEEYQQILEEECDRAGLEASYTIAENTEKVKELVQEKGMTVVEDVDLGAFQEAGIAAYEALDLLDERDQILKELEELE